LGTSIEIVPIEVDPRVEQAFEVGLRHLSLEEIQKANDCDVRMGTFILCVTFVDALSLAYSAGVSVADKSAGKWRRFVERYFSDAYAPVGDAYHALRNLLVHNFGASGFAFVSNPANANFHLQETQHGICLHRETFVEDVAAAFEAFHADVRSDKELHDRVLQHLESFPPMRPVVLEGEHLSD
jgi:hypothetical protein